MRIPNAPDVKPLQHISPSIYEALLRCRARATWATTGDRSALPQHPRALLGICLHSVVEDAHNGKLAGLKGDDRLEAAREIFDQHSKFLYDHAHPLLRTKFSSPTRLPFYNLYRERAALEAVVSAECVERAVHSANVAQPASQLRMYVEKKLISRDGLLVGRPDLIDTVAREIVDYKTGAALDEPVDTIAEAEARQLRLYVHLAQENSLFVSHAVVVRPDGRRVSIDVSSQEADEEGRKARELLAAYNSAAGTTFNDAAQPSVEACQFCPCIPFCEAFWKASLPAWEERCGVHLEGHIAAVEESILQGIKLITLRVLVQRGTVAAGEVFVEQIPEPWATADGAIPPREGAMVRIVHAHRMGDDVPLMIRVDRIATSVWTETA